MEFKEKGLIYVFKRLLNFILRPVIYLIKKNKLLIELFFGFFSKFKFYIPIYSSRFSLVNFPKTKLLNDVREFWYNNVLGEFDLDGNKISRNNIFVYGGPNANFICPICQKSEWLSRIRQKNLFIKHLRPK